MEALQLAIISICAILFSIGGMGLPPFRKGWRRYVLPIALGTVSTIGGFGVLRAVAMTLGLGACLSLPYGEKTPYWLKIGVFGGIYANFLWIGFTPWIIISPIIMSVLFWISNTKWGQNIVFHRVWEWVGGSLIGITFASLIVR